MGSYILGRELVFALRLFEIENKGFPGWWNGPGGSYIGRVLVGGSAGPV